jgi:hypothetical protein
VPAKQGAVFNAPTARKLRHTIAKKECLPLILNRVLAGQGQRWVRIGHGSPP